VRKVPVVKAATAMPMSTETKDQVAKVLAMMKTEPIKQEALGLGKKMAAQG